ncbi:tRNA (adenosine(37)-N6)-threonylcarbamoyltransferase complex ATPase subunit type 1 TsaE [bacterium]|jgi:tRNA threonylcarbamoyladenosine biosynthesis protein TsaE|nr:tRNA (adenosine(37)-N6)-threonylcarbamoyltransferase complex ATPase subunit type 1 TsaE [bacterium]
MTDKFISYSQDDTRALAGKVADKIQKGDVVALFGELGAGKTCFVQGFARAFGITGIVNSPSFAIVNVYEGRMPVYHMDFYRIDSPDEIRAIGCEDYFYGDGVCFIEWAEKAKGIIPPNRKEIYIKIINKTEREIKIKGFNL